MLLANDAGEPKPLELTDYEYERWRVYIRQHSGLQFPETRKRYLTKRLSERMIAVGADGFGGYYEYVTVGAGGAHEWEALLALLVNAETLFFRHQPSYDAFAEYCLPWLIDHRSTAGITTLDIWSAGCSTGQEPYSIGMAFLAKLATVAPHSGGDPWSARILGTDILDVSLSVAQEGVYRLNQLRQLPEPMRDAYMVAEMRGRETVYRVSPELRGMTRFEHLDFNDFSQGWPEDQDLIFCHNVMMHLETSLKEQIIDRLAKSLRPGGFLFLSPSETIGVKIRGLLPITYANVVIYQRQP
jgi:chemotaxis methyl-accepting protein methylase